MLCVSIVSSACTKISVSVSFDSTKDQKKILCVKTYINHNLVSYRICIDYGYVFSLKVKVTRKQEFDNFTV